jgi:hypothetical protein
LKTTETIQFNQIKLLTNIVCSPLKTIKNWHQEATGGEESNGETSRGGRRKSSGGTLAYLRCGTWTVLEEEREWGSYGPAQSKRVVIRLPFGLNLFSKLYKF